MKNHIFAGIDIGSLTTETVLINSENKIIDFNIINTGANSEKAGSNSLHDLLSRNNYALEDVGYIIATGYGRISVPFAHKKITEISCHAKGAHFLNPETRTIIDIGGQDTKVIGLDQDGKVQDFTMNDKCAAGTGRFLEVMAQRLETQLKDMGPIGLQFEKKIAISSVCTVFAESEVVSLIAKGESKSDIINALHDSISERVIAMVNRIHTNGTITMTGGVARNPGVVKILEQKLKTNFYIPDHPQIAGALGAALFAKDHAKQASL